MKKALLISSVTAAMLFFAACGDSGSSGSSDASSSSVTASSSSAPADSSRKYAELIGTEYPLTAFDMPLSTVSFANGFELKATFSVGSGAYHYVSDAENIVYFVSDRGPVITCEESAALTGAEVCPSGEIFPVNDFTPSIIKAEISADKVKILDIIDLKDVNANPVSGVSPSTTNYTIDAYSQDGVAMTHNIDGINPAAIVKTSNGFYIADEYGPSILNVDSDGNIVERLVPESMVGEYANSGYEIIDAFPDIMKHRAPNRGITGLAIDSVESRLFFTLESPLDNPDYTQSTNVRLYIYSIEQGSVKEYWYKLDTTDASVSEIVSIGDNTLLISEKSSVSTKMYKVDLAGAVEVYSEFDNINSSTTFEAITGSTYMADSILPDGRPEMKALTKVELHDTTSSKIDGVADLGNGSFVLVNNTDSTNGDATVVSTVSISVE